MAEKRKKSKDLSSEVVESYKHEKDTRKNAVPAREI
jgi:hypothetical protein